MPRGSAILRRGDPAASLLVILEGLARVTLTSEEGRELTLGLPGPGEVLGELSVLDGEPCSADVTAHEDCTLLAIERAHILALLRTDSALSLRLLAATAGRLRRANDAVEEIAFLDLPTRLGRLLARMARDLGQPASPRGRRLECTLSQRELATFVGASREQVNRLLRAWEEDGTIAKEGGHIVVLRADRLAPDL